MLTFLASDAERLEAFLKVSGINPTDLRSLVGDPQFLAGVADHVLADQSLLLIFCESAGLDPNHVVRSRSNLPGGVHDF